MTKTPLNKNTNDYSWALEKLKAARDLRRVSWTTIKAIHLSREWMVPNRNFVPARTGPEFPGEPHLKPMFLALDVNNGLSPWTPTVEDQLAEDWVWCDENGDPITDVEMIRLDRVTKMQMAVVMLNSGTPEQKLEALNFINGLRSTFEMPESLTSEMKSHLDQIRNHKHPAAL